MKSRTGPQTLTGCLERATKTACGVRFLARKADRPALWLTYAELFQGARRFAADVQVAGGVPSGSRVGLISRTGQGFYHAFFGLMLAGAIPAVLPTPAIFGRRGGYIDRIRKMAEAAALDFVLAGEDKRIEGAGPPVLSLHQAERNEENMAAPPAQPSAIDPDGLAFIQFSSGTTLSPKPIGLTHRQVLYNVRAIFSRVDPGPGGGTGGGVCWLPLHHDMGLIGCMISALVHPTDMTFLTPATFVATPLRWLEAISRYRATTSPAPSFAFGLCAEAKEEDIPASLDLSSWRHAICGAEMIDPRMLAAFTDRFCCYGFRGSAIMPAYGLAEAGLAVTMVLPDAGATAERFDRASLADGKAEHDPSGLPIVGNGPPLPGYEIRIADQAGAPLSARRVGRILIRGGSVVSSYPESYPGAAASAHDWLDSGDDGFLIGKELFVCGRRKEVIILNGANYSAQILEQAATASVPEQIACAAVPFGIASGSTEGVALYVERARHVCELNDDQMMKAISHSVGDLTGIIPRNVFILPAGALPKTTSGKIRKSMLGP